MGLALVRGRRDVGGMTAPCSIVTFLAKNAEVAGMSEATSWLVPDWIPLLLIVPSTLTEIFPRGRTMLSGGAEGEDSIRSVLELAGVVDSRRIRVDGHRHHRVGHIAGDPGRESGRRRGPAARW